MPKLLSVETKLATLRREYNLLHLQNAKGNRAIRILEVLRKMIGVAASTIPDSEIEHHLIRSWAQIAEEGLK
jgi:hypothetical protein